MVLVQESTVSASIHCGA